MEKAGVQGQRTETGQYIRFMKGASFFLPASAGCCKGGTLYRDNKIKKLALDVDVSDAESRQAILNLLDVFNRQVIRVVCDPMPEDGTPVAAFLAELKQVSCVHFM